MHPEHFVAKWAGAGFTESQASQEMFLDICAVVGHPTPGEYGDSQAFTFEKWVAKRSCRRLPGRALRLGVQGRRRAASRGVSTSCSATRCT